MRNYLTDLNIVEAMLCFREGRLLHVSLKNHLENLNKVVVLLDNYNKETEDIVLKYQGQYPDKLIVGYSTIPIVYQNRKQHNMYHRFKRYESQIRQQLLDLVHKENERQPIDLLYWLDADETVTNYFYKEVENFYESDKKALRMGYIHMFDGFDKFSDDHIRAHYRVFKYSSKLQAHPFKGLAQLIPDLKKEEVMHASEGGYHIIHMSDFDLEYINERNIYQRRCKEGHKFEDKQLWKIDKDIRDLTSEEFITIQRTQKSIGMAAEYLEKFGIDKNGIKIQDKKAIKINLGCGVYPLEGFINLDKGRKYGRWYFQNGLNYHDNSVDAITISHSLMYLDVDELWKFMIEAYRVLKIGGVIRITEDNTTDPRSSVYGGYKKHRNPPPFKCLTDAKMMRKALEQAGFKVYDVSLDETHYKDKSLIQHYHGEFPRVFFIEGQKI